jgi:tetratricopeptide (TPR) repeat protein
MSDIRELLSEQIGQANLDLVDIVPIPKNGDRMVRLRTLEEALEDFSDSPDDAAEAVSYLVQVKPRRKASALPPAARAAAEAHPEIGPARKPSAATASATGENIYIDGGKLNIPYLARNAELLLGSGETAPARKIFKAIHASGERTGMALFGLGRCDEAEGRLDDARASYEESIAYHPTLESYRRLSSLLMTQKKDQLAAEVLERALALKELPKETRYELHKACGNSWTRARSPGSAESAESHYNRALEIDPAADEIRANLGALCLQGGRAEDARRHFEDALASNPDNAKALAGLGSCHLASDDKRKAHDCFARSLELELENPAAIYHLVKCAYEIRSYATAARVVEEYVARAPSNANLLYSLAGLQFHLGRASDARATAHKILELNAEHSGARELLTLIERFSGP